MFLCEEWMSSKGGLPTFNREFAISLAKISNGEIKVHCYVSRSSESDREDASKNSVNLITATSIPGTSDPLDWLKIPLPELSHPDIVIGHGRKFGVPAYCIAKTTNCKWVQFVHVFCEDLGKFKQAVAENTDTIEENEKKHKSEIALCKAADAVVAVGTRLQLKYSRCLPDREVHVITPGIFEKFVSLAVKEAGQVTNDQEEFSIFVFGRGTFEDLSLKGYDVIADAVGSLGEKFKMTFVGSPEGQHRKIEEWLLQETRITRDQVTIRGYCDQEELKRMFLEADLVALPSRTEGFGLVALEAISAGVPVLVTSESGIAKALEKVEGGHLAVVKSGNREEWLQKITQLSMQNPKKRCDGAVRLREEYCRIFSWKTQCAKFKEIVQVKFNPALSANRPSNNSALVLLPNPSGDQGILNIIVLICLDSPTTAAGNTLKGLKEMPSVLNLMRRMITAPNLGADMTAEKDNNGKEGQPAENKDSTLLHSAAEGGDVSIIEIILSDGIEVNTKDSFGATPLMIAAAKCKKQAVDFLLSKGADPSLTTNVGRNSLHAAAEGGDVSIVKAMLSHDIPLDSTDNDGITSLMIAVALNNFDTVEFLLSEGADPFLKTNEGRTALFFTALGGHTGVINLVLSCGLEIDSQDDEGVTTLMWAAVCANLQAVRCLLEKGADPLLTANNGWSSLHFASKGLTQQLLRLSSHMELMLMLKRIL
ncbi:unnamed protein product [Porites evermanni]|uniref:PLAT domain-containing protein n=1 Tax=Porites evermanni TaxID=104178 RepID=A0ABN8Q3X8_9CNID|nr:unnamed protein product [Porites evermanni]